MCWAQCVLSHQVIHTTLDNFCRFSNTFYRLGATCSTDWVLCSMAAARFCVVETANCCSTVVIALA